MKDLIVKTCKEIGWDDIEDYPQDIEFIKKVSNELYPSFKDEKTLDKHVANIIYRFGILGHQEVPWISKHLDKEQIKPLNEYFEEFKKAIYEVLGDDFKGSNDSFLGLFFDYMWSEALKYMNINKNKKIDETD